MLGGSDEKTLTGRRLPPGSLDVGQTVAEASLELQVVSLATTWLLLARVSCARATMSAASMAAQRWRQARFVVGVKHPARSGSDPWSKVQFCSAAKCLARPCVDTPTNKHARRGACTYRTLLFSHTKPHHDVTHTPTHSRRRRFRSQSQCRGARVPPESDRGPTAPRPRP